MRGFFSEMQKTIVRLSVFGVICAALILNACLCYTKAADDVIENGAYKKANAYLMQCGDSVRSEFLADYGKQLEAGEWEDELLFSEDVFIEQRLVRELEQRVRQVEEYPDYVQGILDKAKKQDISIFQNVSAYTKRDVTAAAAAFAPLADTKPRFVNSDAFLQATEFPVTDAIALAVLFYLVVSMVVYEKEHGLFRLLRSTKDGRETLIRSKMETGALSAAALAVLFWIQNLGMGIFKYGAIDWSAPLQSVYGYDGSALRVTIGQYLILFLLTKMLVYAAISLLILYFGMKASNTMEIYLGVCLTAAGSAACYVIGEFSGFYILHYANLIFFTGVSSWYRFYCNLNLFGYPVSIPLFSLVCIVSFGAVMGYANRKLFTGKNFSSEIRRVRLLHTGRKETPDVSLCSHERYKLFISEKGLALILLAALGSVWMYGQTSFYLDREEQYYKEYMEHLAGDLNEEKENFLKEEAEQFASYESLLTEKQLAYEEKKISEAEMAAVLRLASEKLEPKSAFERLLDRVDYAREHGTPLVYESGYLKLFGLGYSGYREDMEHTVFLVLVLALFTTPFCAGEYSRGLMNLISSQKYGRRKTLAAKWKAVWLGVVCIYAIIYLPQLFVTGKRYGYAGIGEHISAIPQVSSAFSDCPIWAYLLFVYGFRFLAVCATALFLMAVSVGRKNVAGAISFSLIILAVPAGLHLAGIYELDQCSFNAVYSVHMALNGRNIEAAVGISAILLLWTAGSVVYLARTLGNETDKSK